MRPLIGVTAWRRELDTFLGREMLQTLSAYYSNALIGAGMTPVIFPNAQDPGEAGRLVALVDGLVVSGGDDMDPGSYGSGVDGAKGFDRSVDDFEMSLVGAAREQGKPLLAICRGIQTLNVALGGTLRQEILEAGTVHDVIDDTTDPEELESRSHAVHFEPGSTIAGIYGSLEAKVNTLHHQSIGKLAPALVVEGKTEDGVIEAVRYDGSWWALGVQWHPERMSTDHHGLFHALREATISSATSTPEQ